MHSDWMFQVINQTDCAMLAQCRYAKKLLTSSTDDAFKEKVKFNRCFT